MNFTFQERIGKGKERKRKRKGEKHNGRERKKGIEKRNYFLFSCSNSNSITYKERALGQVSEANIKYHEKL